jgi:hypothetical protein
MGFRGTLFLVAFAACSTKGEYEDGFLSALSCLRGLGADRNIGTEATRSEESNRDRLRWRASYGALEVVGTCVRFAAYWAAVAGTGSGGGGGIPAAMRSSGDMSSCQTRSCVITLRQKTRPLTAHFCHTQRVSHVARLAMNARPVPSTWRSHDDKSSCTTFMGQLLAEMTRACLVSAADRSFRSSVKEQV